MLINFFRKLLNWIYFEYCYLCKKPSYKGSLCEECQDQLVRNKITPVKIIDSTPVYAAGFYNEQTSKLIKAFKFYNQTQLYKPIAIFMNELWQQTPYSKEHFCIIPMPLHKKKKKQRGYDQVLLIANEFAELNGYDVDSKLVTKVKNTKPQYELNKTERKINVSRAFKFNKNFYKGQKLLLMDDILTTGASMEELIRTIKNFDVNDICAIVGAEAVLK